jgi:hypothetical protein
MASVGPATTEGEARQSWTSRYPFEPFNGGQGCSLTASSVSSAVALVGTASAIPINAILICNTGSVWAYVQLGTSSIVATTSSMAVPPGACALVSLTTQNAVGPTFLAAVTASSTTFIQATCGFGGN